MRSLALLLCLLFAFTGCQEPDCSQGSPEWVRVNLAALVGVSVASACSAAYSNPGANKPGSNPPGSDPDAFPIALDPGLCDPRTGDTACATCLKASCCAELETCLAGGSCTAANDCRSSDCSSPCPAVP